MNRALDPGKAALEQSPIRQLRFFQGPCELGLLRTGAKGLLDALGK